MTDYKIDPLLEAIDKEILAVLQENAMLYEQLGIAQRVISYIASKPEGKHLLCKMILEELDKIDWHISGAIAQCEMKKAQEPKS